MPESLVIANQIVDPGQEQIIKIPVASAYDYTEMTIPVRVIRGKEAGPILFLSAAIHGDELNGVEIVKRVSRHKALKELKGTVLAVPIVNVFGFNSQSRYLPDRRDLNRNFPGSPQGSLAARMAYLFMEEIVKKSTHGIDLHTGAIHRSNLPQVRAYLDDPMTKKLALDFGVPVVLNSAIRDGSLREASRELNIPILLYEGGQALRFDEDAIRAGVRGVLSVMTNIGMIPQGFVHRKKISSFVAKSSFWIRAPHSGMIRMHRKLGMRVEKGQELGVISDPFGKKRVYVRAKEEGIIVGRNNLPLVNRGDALFHVACFKNIDHVQENLDAFDDLLVES